MRILMISAEGPPLKRKGALMDVMEPLSGALRERGHEVSLAVPYYKEIREDASFSAKDTGITVEVRVGEETYVAEYLESRSDRGIQLFLIRCDEFFDRPGIYAEDGTEYEDNSTRFIFFSKAVIELARRLTPAIQLLHVHDWAPALIPVLVHAHQLPFSTVLTIYHVEEQGSFWGLDFKLTNLHERFFNLRGIEFFGRMNLLKGGILYSERLTTLSEWHLRAILTPEGGAGMDIVLRENAYKLRAVLNGIDYAQWDPAKASKLIAPYSSRNLSGKLVNRDRLLSHFQLLLQPRGPVFGMHAAQIRGLGIVVPLLERLLSDDVRVIILGEVEREFQAAVDVFSRKFAGKFAWSNQVTEKAVRLLLAGSDVTLFPAGPETSGADAMRALRYGSLPVAQAIPGIQDVIEDWDPTMDRGYGFLCYVASTEAFWDAIKRASADFRDQPLWQKLMGRAMSRDFSWAKSAAGYEAVYTELLGAETSAAA